MKEYVRITKANPELPAFVYVLEDPRLPGEIRYIGCTQSPQGRSVQHLSGAKQGRECPVYEWIRYLRAEGVLPRLRILWEGPLTKMYEKEVAAIAAYRRLGFPLLNVTDGGPGHICEYRPKPAQSIAMKGRTHLAEWIRKHGPVNKGKPGPKASSESRRKMSEARKGKLHTEAHKSANKASWTPERRARQAERMKGNTRARGGKAL